MGSIVTQDDSDSIGRRIVVSDVLGAARISHELGTFDPCPLRAA